MPYLAFRRRVGGHGGMSACNVVRKGQWTVLLDDRWGRDDARLGCKLPFSSFPLFPFAQVARASATNVMIMTPEVRSSMSWGAM